MPYTIPEYACWVSTLSLIQGASQVATRYENVAGPCEKHPTMVQDLRGSLVHEQEIGWQGNALAALREVRVDHLLECLFRNVPQLSRRVPPVWELHIMHSYLHLNRTIYIRSFV